MWARESMDKTARCCGWASALLMTTALAGIAGTPSRVAAQASETAQERGFAIPAGTLADALVQFGYQSGLQVAADGGLAATAGSPGVSGHYSPAEALSRLLAGTGLTYRFTSVGSVQLEPAPRTGSGAIKLGPVQVEGQQDGGAGFAPDPTTEKSGSYAASGATVASRTPLALEEIPASVSVMTRQRMDDQNVTTIQEALRYVTGVEAIDYGDSTAYFRARGNQLGIEFDGVPIFGGLQYQPQFDLALYDRIEALRGPSGVMDGAGEPGGTVNLVRKRPSDTFALSTETQLDSFGSGRQMVDVTGPLTVDGSVRGRAVLVGSDGLQSVHGVRDKIATGYVAIDADLGPDTTLSLSGAYQVDTVDGLDYGAPGVVDSTHTYLVGRVESSTSQNFSPDWNNSFWSMQEANANLQQRLGNDWNSQTTVFYRHVLSRSIYAYSGPGATSDGLAYYGDQRQYDTFDWFGADTNLSGPIDLLGQTHTVTIGANYSRMTDHEESGFVALNGPYPGGLYNLFDPNTVPEVNVPYTFGSNDRIEQYGVYGQARIHVADPLTLVLGTRAAFFNQSTQNILPTVSNWTTQADIEHRFLPSAALVWDVLPGLTAYAGYSKFLAAQTATTYTGAGLPPRSGAQYEAGVKGSLLDGKLSATAAAFHIDDDHRAVEDPLHPSGDIDGGKARDQGVEFELTGQPAPNWNVYAGYTYLDVGYDNDVPNLTDGTDPKHLFKLWTDYRFAQGALDGFSVGGGMLAQSTINRGVAQGGYAIFNAQAGYRISANVTASLQVNNLFDRSYYVRPPSTFFSQLGDRRNEMLTIRATF